MGNQSNAAAATLSEPQQYPPPGSQPPRAPQPMNPSEAMQPYPRMQPSAGIPGDQMYPPTKSTPGAAQNAQLGQPNPSNRGSQPRAGAIGPVGQQQSYPPQQQMSSYDAPAQSKYATNNPAAAAPAEANGGAVSAQPWQSQQPARGIGGAGRGRDDSRGAGANCGNQQNNQGGSNQQNDQGGPNQQDDTGNQDQNDGNYYDNGDLAGNMGSLTIADSSGNKDFSASGNVGSSNQVDVTEKTSVSYDLQYDTTASYDCSADQSYSYEYDASADYSGYDATGAYYEYDESGNQYTYDENGEAYYTGVAYDENGYEFAYDENGKVYYEQQYDENGYEFAYDENGKVYYEQQYDENGYEYAYDENGEAYYIGYDETGAAYDESGAQYEGDDETGAGCDANGEQDAGYDETGAAYDEQYVGYDAGYDEAGAEYDLDVAFDVQSPGIV